MTVAEVIPCPTCGGKGHLSAHEHEFRYVQSFYGDGVAKVIWACKCGASVCSDCVDGGL